MNKVWNFKGAEVKNLTPGKKTNYKDYKPFLKEDFSYRCAYCNTSEVTIGTVPFHIDHFVPRKKFEGVLDDLDVYYDNLMWSCPRCNMKKGKKHEGKISLECENTLLINPRKENSNEVFYRNHIGGIESAKSIGVQTIMTLDLSHPVYNVLFFHDKLTELNLKYEKELEVEGNPLKKELFSKINCELIKLSRFISAYY